MACIYSDFEGKCTLWDENIERNGCSEDGYCTCEEDPNPTIMCEDFQSVDGDDMCGDCGEHFSECTCDE